MAKLLSAAAGFSGVDPIHTQPVQAPAFYYATTARHPDHSADAPKPDRPGASYVMKLRIALLIFLLGTSQVQAVPCQNKLVVKAIEPVILLGKPQVRLLARMDTGATLSSIDRELALRLGFNTPIRQTSVSNAHGTTLRPVVKIPFLLKGRKRIAEFTLAERSHLDYAVLLGRTSLSGFLVDPELSDIVP